MRTKVTLFLLFLNAALFFFIFRFERDWRTERAALEVRRKVLGPETASLRSITVAAAGSGAAYRLEQRGEESWFLTEPMEWPANLSAVHRIVSNLELLGEHHRASALRDVLKSGQTLADYGLEPARLVVTLTAGGPEVTGAAPVTTTQRIGEMTKADAAKGEQSVYVLSPDGSRIHVVGRELVDSLTRPLDQLRSDAILTIPVYEARSLFLQAAGAPGAARAPGPRVRLHPDRDGRWRFDSPLNDARADKNLTELAIDGLDNLRVKSFVPTAPSGPQPPDNPLLQVSIDGNGRHQTLWVGQPVNAAPGTPGPPAGDREYYAQLEGLTALFTVVIPGPLMGELSNALEALRDRHVLDFDAAAVTAITLDAPSQQLPEITLQRLEASATGGTGWQIVQRGQGASGPQRADSGAVQTLLSQLSLLTARTFQNDAPQGADLENWGFNLQERLIKLSLSAAPGSPAPTPLVLEIGVPTPRDDRAYARVVGSSSVYAVSPDILAETPLAPLAWRDRQLAFLPTGARITGLRITDLLSEASVVDWKADGPGAAPSAVQDLLRQLAELRAARFVGDAFADTVKDENGQVRPWRYKLEADLSLPAGAGGAQARTATLWLTVRTSGSGQYAGSTDFNAVFALEAPLVEALDTLTYGPRDPGPSPATAPAPKPAAAP